MDAALLEDTDDTSNTSTFISTSPSTLHKRSRDESNIGHILSPITSNDISHVHNITSSTTTNTKPVKPKSKRVRTTLMTSTNVGMITPAASISSPAAVAAAASPTTTATVNTPSSATPKARSTRARAQPKATSTGPGVGILSPSTPSSVEHKAEIPVPIPSNTVTHPISKRLSLKHKHDKHSTLASNNIGMITSPSASASASALPATRTTPADDSHSHSHGAALCVSGTPHTAPARTRSPTYAPSSPTNVVPLPHQHLHPLRTSHEPISDQEIQGMDTLKQAICE